MIHLGRLDHLVLTVADIERSCSFYSHVLGMKVEIFGQGRKALRFGQQKINLHQAGHEFEPKAARPTPGSGDLCFVSQTPLENVMAHLHNVGVSWNKVRWIAAARPVRSTRFTCATRTETSSRFRARIKL